MNVADYLAKQYPEPPCWALAASVYLQELNEPVDGFKTITESVRQVSAAIRMQAIATAFRLALHKNPDGFRQIDEPVDFALVMMGRNEKTGFHHVGIYYQGKVLHALQSMPVYQDMASLGDEYQLMQFWAKA